jgi:hypothetical protein
VGAVRQHQIARPGVGRSRAVTIVGHSLCSEPALAGPALWTATIRDDKVALWRVYTDTPGNRHALGLPDRG